jgi:hypothetical protein
MAFCVGVELLQMKTEKPVGRDTTKSA